MRAREAVGDDVSSAVPGRASQRPPQTAHSMPVYRDLGQPGDSRSSAEREPWSWVTGFKPRAVCPRASHLQPRASDAYLQSGHRTGAAQAGSRAEVNANTCQALGTVPSPCKALQGVAALIPTVPLPSLSQLRAVTHVTLPWFLPGSCGVTHAPERHPAGRQRPAEPSRVANRCLSCT